MNGFEPAEGHGERRSDRRPVDRTGRDIDPAGNVDGDHWDTAFVHSLKHLGRRRAQRTLTGDAHHRVNHQIGAGPDRGNNPSAGRSERAQSVRVGVLGTEQDGICCDASAAQKNSRPQSVAAVVTGADDNANSAAGNAARTPTQFTGDRVGQTGCCTTHQRTVG